MSEDTVKVMICDDSALMRNLVGKMIENTEGISVAGKAMNGRFLLQKLEKSDPDVILLDLEMPEMNGIDFLRERRKRGIDIPVVILSSIATRGAKITMEALALGASDFILKPSGSISEDIHVVEQQITETVKAYGLKYKHKKNKQQKQRITEDDFYEKDKDINAVEAAEDKKLEEIPDIEKELKKQKEVTKVSYRDVDAAQEAKIRVEEPPVPRPGKVEIVAIGISTGGPNALRIMLPKFGKDFPVPVLVVQHMPAGFTNEFAKSLDKICSLDVKEAEEGDLIKKGRILIAPGNYHMEIEKRPLSAVVRLSSITPVNGHRPSVDVLFASVAKTYGGKSLAVIMTGMGRDGAKEIGSIFKLGGITIGQDQKSSIVYGMPKIAAENGYLQYISGLSEIGETIVSLLKDDL